MKTLIAEWDRIGKNITAIVYYMFSFLLTISFVLLGMARLVRGHESAAFLYFVLCLMALLLFLYTSERIRRGTIGRPIGKGFQIVVFGFLLGFTALFFTDGGLRGGALFFFLFAMILTPCFFRTRLAVLLMVIEACACLCNVTVSFFYPASVRGSSYDLYDLLLPFVLTAVLLSLFSAFYIYAYHRQKDNLTDALEEARSAGDAKAAFLDNMSHEIRTPMNTILGMNEMILREEDRPEIREYAAQIQRSGLALLTVINDILDYSKLQDNKMTITPIRYDLSSLINDMVNIAVDLTKRKSLDFRVFADREIPRVLIGDEFHIRQIILNILNNAVKYTESGGVTLRAGYEKKDDETILLKISVEDTGVGIRKEDMEKIFAPFEHAGDTYALRPEGAGLGLSIVRSLLDLMGSHLEITSVRGEGSTFSFAIEQQVQKWEALGDYTHAFREANVHATAKQSFIAPDAHVLVVDDTPVNLVVFKNLLKNTQMQIDTASGGEEMLQMTRARAYDMIFLDHRMPGMDGVQAFHAMRKMKGSRNQKTPVIALTANAVMGARQMYLNEGFQDYLSKPIDSLRLEEMIRTHLSADLINDVGTAEQLTPSDKETPAGENAADPYRTLTGIDYDAAVTNCGAEAIFKEALGIFYDTIEENAAKIEGFAAEGDLKNYTILVHALKSSARLVGALQLSADALHLEEAGNAEDKAEIDAKTPALLQDYRAYIDHLAVVCKKEADETLPEMTADEIAAFYDEIRQKADEFDLDALDEALERASSYRLPENEQDRFERVKIAVRGADWGALEDALK